MDLLNGTIKASLNPDGNWSYKSTGKMITPFKKNGALKVKYHDLPRFKVIIEYEKDVKQSYQKIVLHEGVLEAVSLLKLFAK